MTVGLLTLGGGVQPWSLPTIAAILGVGGALAAPAFQSVVPDLVPRYDSAGAVG